MLHQRGAQIFLQLAGSPQSGEGGESFEIFPIQRPAQKGLTFLSSCHFHGPLTAVNGGNAGEEQD